MTHYAFVDESGTKDDQEVMTVALIVLEGVFSAQRIHRKIAEQLYPKQFASGTKTKFKANLHYVDMKKAHRLESGRVLGVSAVDCFCGCFYHDGREKAHTETFAIYTNLVKSCLGQAFEYYEDLHVCIDQQGGSSEYKDAFLKELDAVREEASRRHGFRKARFEIVSSSKAGIQLVDYYAGAVRDYLLRHRDPSLAGPYELIQDQVRDISVADLSLSTWKG